MNSLAPEAPEQPDGAPTAENVNDLNERFQKIVAGLGDVAPITLDREAPVIEHDIDIDVEGPDSKSGVYASHSHTFWNSGSRDDGGYFDR